MVTAIGPGGVGKTRLVLRVAAEVAGQFADGVVFVDLVQVNDPSMVAAAIAEACGVPERHGTSVEAALTASLSRRRVLLVVDNCEHLLDGVRDCLDALLAALSRRAGAGHEPRSAPDAVRARLRGAGLSSSDGVALFMDRAAASGPGSSTPRASPCCAGPWMAWPWRSSWLRPGARRSGSMGWRPGSISACAS